MNTTFKTIKEKLINKNFPNKTWTDDSIVAIAIDKAFGMAWGRGYSAGEDAIEFEFGEIIEIIKPLID